MKQYRILIVPCILFIFSCASLDSVKSTGKITQSLSNSKEVYDNKLCDIDFVFNDQDSDYCEKYTLNDSIRIKTIDLLTVYGKTLEQFVEQSRFSAGDQISLLMGSANAANWTRFSGDQIEGSQKISNSIFSIINNKVKQKTLRNLILDNNEAFQKIINSLSNDLVLRKEFYTRIAQSIETYMNSDTQLDADRREVLDNETNTIGFAKRNRLDNINIRIIQNNIEAELIKIESALKRFKAVGHAHDILAKNYTDIGTKEDFKVLELIINDLKNIYEGMEKLKPSENN
ncbi:hypothetical protein SAMN05444483_11172 [Salegentibacter echinorum]|uniref:Uncharacterized protein n=1 Tax=Salegentibacter echinorum TaxID=1073325 RepID=A0A1M5JLI6_SALEC|nr:hypothetical protein [Salegentibacter echinorum]SHG41432.1 hypothetical protein SAMN05444483_11172 [Salegentibacter echinorum]